MGPNWLIGGPILQTDTVIRNVSEMPLSPFVCEHAMYTDRDTTTESGYYLCRLYVLLGDGG